MSKQRKEIRPPRGAEEWRWLSWAGRWRWIVEEAIFAGAIMAVILLMVVVIVETLEGK